MLNIFAKSIMTAARSPEPRPKAPKAYHTEAPVRADREAQTRPTEQRRV